LKTITDLNKWYQEAESVDKTLFSEMRSNVLLVSGDHYAKKSSRFWGRVRTNEKVSNDQKLRLTKNHLGRIAKRYVSSIISESPDVQATPYTEGDLADQKKAELHNSVLQDIKIKCNTDARIQEWGSDYVNLGECAVKVFHDPTAGDFMGKDEEEQPIFRGNLVFERIFGFNLLRSASAKNLDEADLCIRKMVEIDHLKAMIDPADEDKLKMIQEASQDTFTVFEGSTGNFYNVKGKCLVREYYFRPCAEYPVGYFYYTTEYGILFEGEIPFGIWPIHFCTFDEIPTTPRGRSIIKQLRPYQAEVNRCASAIATHQITLGDDKLLVQSGTKLGAGGQLPGVRGVTFSGMAPTVLPGRSGAQYLDYMNAQITEMYQVADLEEIESDKTPQVDPWSYLFRKVSQKKKFNLYTKKFERFLQAVFTTALELKKKYVQDDELIQIVGKKEQVNIPEFRSADRLCYEVKVEPRVDDLETQMGKQMTLNHILQYVGNSLDKDSIGQVMRAMPFGNSDLAYEDLTIDYDNACNDILSLNRGQYPQANPYDNHKYMIRKLTHRMKQSDFQFLAPQIQNLFKQKLMEHEQIEVMQQKAIQAAQNEMIPTSGFLVAADFYVPDPADPAKTRRARIPYDALAWLIKRIEEQGVDLEGLEKVQQGAVSDMARQMISSRLPRAVGSGQPQ
jgi:hypothetical protein